MEYRRLNRVVAGIVLGISFMTYALTVQPSISFWDCAEFSVAAYTLGIPHPPGAPFHSILGRFFGTVLPFIENVGLRINLISVVTSALTVMILYLTIVRVMLRWRSTPRSTSDLIIHLGSAFIGALTFSFTDTFWFSAVESEVYASSMLFISLTVFLGLVWYDHADEEGNERYLYMIAFVMGLSLGVHQLSILPFFTIGLFIYYKYNEVNVISLLRTTFLISGAFFLIWLSMTSWLPAMFNGDFRFGPVAVSDNEFVRYIPWLVIAVILYGIYHSYVNNKRFLHIACVSVLLMVIGFSTYTQIYIRAHSKPPLNENNPSTTARFASYMNREQYGDMPSVFERRWNREMIHQHMYGQYESDADYFWRYQLGHMFFRYFGWNFIGRAGDVMDAPVAFISSEARWYESKGFPNRYFGIPLLLGLFGLWYQLKKDWKFGLAFIALFGMLGFAIVMQQNFAEPQPRERETFFVGAFFTFALWIGCGCAGILELLEARLRKNKTSHPEKTLGRVLAVLALIVPVNMGFQNWADHDRSGNYVPFDASYNVLQSVEKDAILFTGGDNDTMPLWYLQDVEGIRRDVRVVNLSLLNLPWYISQLKDEEPWGAKKIDIRMSDAEIDHIVRAGSLLWKTHDVEMPVPREVFKAFRADDSTAIASGKISWTMRSTLIEGSQAIRPYEVFVREIMIESKWTRPLYFAATVPETKRIGLDPFLCLEGMAFRMTPVYSPSRFRVDEAALLKHIDSVREQPLKERAYGFLFRNLQNPRMYFAPDDQHCIANYRVLWLLSAVAMSDGGRVNEAARVMTMVERYTPENNFPVTDRFKLDAARIYLKARQKEKFEEYVRPIEKKAWETIQSGAVNSMGREGIEPWQLLIDVSKARDDRAQLMQIYNTLIMYYPRDTALHRQINEYRRLLDTGSIE